MRHIKITIFLFRSSSKEDILPHLLFIWRYQYRELFQEQLESLWASNRRKLHPEQSRVVRTQRYGWQHHQHLLRYLFNIICTVLKTAATKLNKNGLSWKNSWSSGEVRLINGQFQYNRYSMSIMHILSRDEVMNPGYEEGMAREAYIKGMTHILSL